MGDRVGGAPGQRRDEAANRLRMLLHGGPPGNQDQLVVGRHSELVDRDDARVESPLLKVDALDVPEAAQNRVDPPGDQGGEKVEADVDLVRGRGRQARGLQDRLKVVRLVRDSGRPDGLPPQVGAGRDAGLREGDQRGQRLIDDGAHRLDVQPLVLGEQDLGLVGDGEVGAPRGHLLDRRGGIGRDLRVYVQALRPEEPAVEPAVDPGMVRVDVPVEGEREGGRVRGGARGGLVLSAARGQTEPDRGGRDQDRETHRDGQVRVTPRESQVTTFRSISETTANRTIAITESRVIAANIRAVSRLLEAIRI